MTVNPSAEAGLFTSHSPNLGNGRPLSWDRMNGGDQGKQLQLRVDGDGDVWSVREGQRETNYERERERERESERASPPIC